MSSILVCFVQKPCRWPFAIILSIIRGLYPSFSNHNPATPPPSSQRPSAHALLRHIWIRGRLLRDGPVQYAKDLPLSLLELKRFTAKWKLRRGLNAVVAMVRLRRMANIQPLSPDFDNDKGHMDINREIRQQSEWLEEDLAKQKACTVTLVVDPVDYR